MNSKPNTKRTQKVKRPIGNSLEQPTSEPNKQPLTLYTRPNPIDEMPHKLKPVLIIKINQPNVSIRNDHNY